MQVIFRVFNNWNSRGAERGQDPPMVPTNACGMQVFLLIWKLSGCSREEKARYSVEYYESRRWFPCEGMTGGAVEGLRGAGFLFPDLVTPVGTLCEMNGLEHLC